MKKNAPAVHKIIIGDYFTFFGILILLLVAVISLYFILTEEITSLESFYLLLVAVVILLVLVFLLLMRIRLICYVFSCGKQIRGKIERIKKNSRRGFTVNSRIIFSYQFKGRKYKKSRFLLSDEKLRSSQNISIIVDPDKPNRAFIYSVFTDG